MNSPEGIPEEMPKPIFPASINFTKRPPIPVLQFLSLLSGKKANGKNCVPSKDMLRT
jgi:hypothetical protein